VSSQATRTRLEHAALASLREDGVAGLSARTIARRADANQALVFYHYGTVTALVAAAALDSVTTAVDRYRLQFDAAGSFAELLAVGRALHESERAAGNVAVMAQLTAAAQTDPVVAETARRCLDSWADALEPTVRRLLRTTPLDGLVDHHGLTRAVSASFLGMELYEGVDPAAAAAALVSLEQLGAVLEAVNDLGPIARRAVRARLRRRPARQRRS
jgi:AcrR family transcriptional regulator